MTEVALSVGTLEQLLSNTSPTTYPQLYRLRLVGNVLRAFLEESCSLPQLCPVLLEASGSLVLTQSLVLLLSVLCRVTLNCAKHSLCFTVKKTPCADFCECLPLPFYIMLLIQVS